MGCEAASTSSTNFALIICISGKRKSGKDYVAHNLAKTLLKSEGGEGVAGRCRVFLCGISHPLKEEYAKLHKLDHERLKSDDRYKEEYRQEMVSRQSVISKTHKHI